ncbi:PDZ domain-containing protein [Haloferula sp. BvORR071]|uniref:S1C family serine protease n=1 Tax=Haloferula sp. BvORR071 TaxID=1396141 RepID=UPI00055502AC|nr:PDZ domain-containing protein [Haloferula sp. BvORR071]
MQARRCFRFLVAGIAVWVIPATAFCQAAKWQDSVKLLASENFREREEAQGKLMEWARSEPIRAMDLIFGELEKATDPEVRLRLRESLRELVIADHQKNHGEGYVGIRMLELNVAIPGDNLPRTGVQVADVVADSPAEHAGLKTGDVIVSLAGLRWSGAGAPEAFSGAVRKLKPGDKVKLEILRNGELSEATIELGVRPLGMPEAAPRLLFANGAFVPPPDPAVGEEKAREDVFRGWLENKRAAQKGP